MAKNLPIFVQPPTARGGYSRLRLAPSRYARGYGKVVPLLPRTGAVVMLYAVYAQQRTDFIPIHSIQGPLA